MKPQIFLFAFSLALAGCATTRTPTTTVPLLGERPHFESLSSFNRFVKTTPGTEDYERAQIDYLLERMSTSPYHFIRNGVEYSNAKSVMHLRWKYLHYKKDAPSAEAFIDHIATGSKKTGQEYLIRKNPGEVYPLKLVLRRELDLLFEGLRAYQGKTCPLQQSSQLKTSEIANKTVAGIEDQTIKKNSQPAEVISHNKQPI